MDNMDNMEANSFWEYGEEDDDFLDIGPEDDGSGRSESERFDIPDLPPFFERFAPNNIPLSESELKELWEDEMSLSTLFDPVDTELIPGFSRSILARKNVYGPTYGAKVCQALAKDLKMNYDKYLFGLIDGIYLLCTRSATYERGQVSAGVNFIWFTEETPYQLILPKVTDIMENEELVYLLIGDLLDEYLDDLENGRSREKWQNQRRR